jgi:hypothetical protein
MLAARNQKMLACTLGLWLCGSLPVDAGAFDYPLSEEAVRDAYFLGQNVQKAAPFLRQYIRRFPVAQKGPYVREIGLRTPYAEVVHHTFEHSLNYSAQRAQKDYVAQTPRIVVTVLIFFGRNYLSISQPKYGQEQSAQNREEFWREFPVIVTQEKPILPSKVTSRSLYGTYGSLSGAEVTLEFDPEQFTSAATRVAVNTPSGQITETNFDLEVLR